MTKGNLLNSAIGSFKEMTVSDENIIRQPV